MKSIEELNAVKEKTLARLNGNTVRIVVGMATCGIAAGAKPVFDALKEETDLTPDQFDDLMATIRPELEFFGKTLN